MKRTLIFLLAAMTFLAMSVVGCSQRSTVYQKDTVLQIDTVYQKDTVFQIDTVYKKVTVLKKNVVYQKDTVFQIDTVYKRDTVFLIDTVCKKVVAPSKDTAKVEDATVPKETRNRPQRDTVKQASVKQSNGKVAKKSKKKAAEPEPEMGTYPVYDDEYEYREKSPFCMSLKTNMLVDALAVPNFGLEFHIAKNWTVGGDFLVALWNDKARFCEHILGGDIFARKYFGRRANEKPLTGHHVGIYGQVGMYDVSWKFSKNGYKSNLCYGAGVEYGYSLPVARRLNIDFSLGVGYFGGNYAAYKFDEDNLRVPDYNNRSFWIGPTKAEVTLVWLIGNGNYNKTKRGI